MKTASAALKALLATRNFISADLFTFTLIDGTVLYYTSYAKDITVNGNTYSSGGQTGPYFERITKEGLCSWKIGLEVSTLQFTVFPGPSGTVEGFPLMSAVRLGLFDGATCQLERCFMATDLDVTAGTVILFLGSVGEIDAGRSNAIFNINSMVDLLNMNMPRNLYQASCANTLFDSPCSLVKASFGVNGAILTGSTAGTINATLSQATGYFDLGSVTFTSGQNNGFKRGIKAFTNGSPSNFTLMVPLPFTPAISDTFTIYPGCDKTQTTCQNKFNNLANFRGVPYLPQPETAV